MRRRTRPPDSGVLSWEESGQRISNFNQLLTVCAIVILLGVTNSDCYQESGIRNQENFIGPNGQ